MNTVRLFVHGQASSGYNAHQTTYENVVRDSIRTSENTVSFNTVDGKRVISNLLYIVEVDESAK